MMTTPTPDERDQRLLDAMETGFVTRFGKSGRNHQLEVRGKDFVLLDRRFQRPDGATSTAILSRMGLAGAFTGASFDLVMMPEPAPPLTLTNIDDHIDDVTLIEMKTTAKPIQNKSLAGFFFGSTETQYELSRLAGDRIRWAFVVLNSDNDYGHPFFTLITFDELQAKTRSKRIQYQVNFQTSAMPLPTTEAGPYPDPAFVSAEDLARMQEG